MKPPTEKQAASAIIDVLADVFDSSPKQIRLQKTKGHRDYDYSVSVAGHRFLAEYKMFAASGPLLNAIERLKQSAEIISKKGIPLIVVPFMGPIGRELCKKSGVSWLDLAGNASITAQRLRISIEGRPNKFSDRGRPPNLFAPKSSRITRQLLFHPQRFQTQSELARKGELGDGYVSKIVRRLERDQYLDSNERGAVRPRDPNLLLDAWNGVYDFSRHRVTKGHIPARSGEELLQRIVDVVSRGHQYAATGLSAAWLYTGFAAFRLVTVYLATMPSRSLLKEMEFSEEQKGANVWLVLPNDDGVFHGSQEKHGIRCTSAVQTYLDLKGQPERAKDAAVELRRKLLNWRPDGE